ncbi:MAG: class F sortase, partial [Tepidiformaceae bacterium]
MQLVMRRLSYLLATGLVAFFAGAAGWVAMAPGQGHAQAALPAAPALASELRYIGRDTGTGMAAPVNDRFIAAVEKSIADYGKDAGTPVPPPPPVPGADVATLTVQALGIESAPVERYGLDAYGRLDVPQDNHTVGWNPAYAAEPGTGGATFFAAHYEFGGKPGIFNQLSTLSAGDTITVGLTDGTQRSYRVTSAVDYNLAAIDMGAILQGR